MGPCGCKVLNMNNAIATEIETARNNLSARGKSAEAVTSATAAWIDMAFERGDISSRESALLQARYGIAR